MSSVKNTGEGSGSLQNAQFIYLLLKLYLHRSINIIYQSIRVFFSISREDIVGYYNLEDGQSQIQISVVWRTKSRDQLSTSHQQPKTLSLPLTFNSKIWLERGRRVRRVRYQRNHNWRFSDKIPTVRQGPHFKPATTSICGVGVDTNLDN